jgi:hypothetical protein
LVELLSLGYELKTITQDDRFIGADGPALWFQKSESIYVCTADIRKHKQGRPVGEMLACGSLTE